MKKGLFILLFVNMLLCVTLANAQEAQKSNLQQQAETADKNKEVAKARSLYIHAFNDYAGQNQLKAGVECAAKAAALYYKENLYQEAFDLLRRVDQTIAASKLNTPDKAALNYLTTKERLQMYINMRRAASAQEQLNKLENHAALAGGESINNDLLYTKTIYYYTFGQNEKGNAVFKEMATKLTAQKEYDKVEEAYKALIANGRKSGSAQLVAQSYSNYVAWKDSTNAQKVADEINGLKQQIADHEATIADKDSSLSMRWATIIGLCVLVAALAVALILGALVLLRYIALTRKQKNIIRLANESNALKVKFISNISAQLNPTIDKLDKGQPEIKALKAFSSHIQTLSTLENTDEDSIELEETPVQTFCEEIVDQIRDKVKTGVTLSTEVPKMNANIHREYVTHILRHLLENAAEYTPEGGKISLVFKKRGPHTYQALVTNTGDGIPEEKQEDVFKPFLEIRDLTQGDGLGLPICKQMALKMKGDLTIDPQYTKGARFILDLHT